MRLWHRTQQHLRILTGGARRRRFTGVAMMSMSLVLLACLTWDAAAQRRQRATPLSPSPPAVVAPPPAAGAGTVAGASVELPPERVQADVSARRIAVTASFSGTEVVVFGAVDNSRQLSPEAGLYDIVIVVEGAPTRLVARRKSMVAGVWINSSSLAFESVPSFYAIASTRPLDEIAADDIMKKQEIGFQHARMKLATGADASLTPEDLKQWREAVVRIKRKDKLYVAEDYSVVFIGRSLFRATVDLPANVTVGLFDTRVYLFRGGELLHSYTARLDLEREGLELWLHAFAFKQPLLYGIMTVLMAVGAGLLASTLFSRATH